MTARVLSVLGQDRAFELFEFLVLFFVLVSVATLVFLAIYQVRSRRAARAAAGRVDALVSHLGRHVFGEDGWEVVERSVSASAAGLSAGSRLDTLLALLDRESLEMWVDQAVQDGDVDPEEIRLLHARLKQPDEARRLIAEPSSVAECNPTFGMPVAVNQGTFQTRGTIAEVDERSFAIWILGDGEGLDDSEEASFILLSRSGPYQFTARFTRHPDGSIVVPRPARVLHSQRRRFDRHPARLPVIVRPYLADEEPVEAVITELSGGGATVANPAKPFAVGNVLTLSFIAGGRSYTVAGRVVRADGTSGPLHVRFEALKDQERHEIAVSVALTDPAGASNGRHAKASIADN